MKGTPGYLKKVWERVDGVGWRSVEWGGGSLKEEDIGRRKGRGYIGYARRRKRNGNICGGNVGDGRERRIEAERGKVGFEGRGRGNDR